MKRISQHKKRPSVSKKGLKPRRRYFKTIKSLKKSKIGIDSPYNSNQYLIENSSSPFLDENDDDFDTGFVPSALILVKDPDDLIDEDSLSLKKISFCSTRGESLNIDSHLIIEQPYLI